MLSEATRTIVCPEAAGTSGASVSAVGAEISREGGDMIEFNGVN